MTKVYTWRTTKTETGYRWQVIAIEHAQPIQLVEQGDCSTRAKASLRARRAVMPYRRGEKQA
jgi:hypothetical protein